MIEKYRPTVSQIAVLRVAQVVPVTQSIADSKAISSHSFSGEYISGNTRMYLNADFTIKKTSEKLRFLEDLLKEIYWNDCSYTARTVLDLLDKRDNSFLPHFLGRVIANASFPTQALLKLFSAEELSELLEKVEISGHTYEHKRFEILMYNITGQGNPGVPAWQ